VARPRELFRWAWTGAGLVLAAVSCGASHASDPGGSLADGDAGVPSGPCDAVVQQRAIEGFQHVDVCSPVVYLTKPPSSGNHYPIWAAYKSYTSAIPEGFWVHDLEHGAVVFSYNCPDGCPGDVSAAQSLIDALPGDPQCDPAAGDPPTRMVMTPDPNLDVTFAASAWGWTLRASCFDPAAFGAFVAAHYGNGREPICAQGDDVSTGLQPGCGQ
jgi:Protein of unknown function (DUF3105)